MNHFSGASRGYDKVQRHLKLNVANTASTGPKAEKKMCGFSYNRQGEQSFFCTNLIFLLGHPRLLLPFNQATAFLPLH